MKILVSESQYKRLVESLLDESILIIGDSHSVDAGFTYSSLLKKKFSDVKISASVGQGTSWMKSELARELTKKHYDKVIIWGGNNDIGSTSSISGAISNIQQMVNMVNSQDGQSYVIIGFDQEVFTKKVKNKMRERYIDLQKQLSSEISNAVIIPAFDIDNSYTSDNVHGNKSAHEKVFRTVTEYLQKTTQKEKQKDESKNSETLMSRLEDYLDSGLELVARKRGSMVYEKEVEDIQTALQFLGFSLPKWGVDGKFGPETKKATENFQEENDLEVTGIFSIKDFEKLIDVLESKGVTDEDFMNVQKNKTEELSSDFESTDFETIENSGIQVSKYPNDIENRLQDILGKEKFNIFVSKCRGIGLDPLIAIRQLYTESVGFSPDVLTCKRKSPAGAMGIAQFMPGTWPSYGKGSPCNVDDALDAYIRFMDYLLKRYEGRVDLAVASYNSGPNLNIYKKTYNSNTPFASLKGKIPGETYKYASTILQA
jgi:peptidoglycan hydrolase-like protein with peptidoglycan-binding domain